MPKFPSPRRSGVVAGLAVALSLAALPTVSANSLLGGSAIDRTVDVFRPQLVTVTADREGRNLVADSGLDVTEHAGDDEIEVVLHTPADLVVLEALGFPYEVRIADLLLREAQVQQANEAYAAAVDTSPLPSGRTAYRTLEDYNAEMVALAEQHPDIVKLLELPHETIEGKTVLGIEIATDVNESAAADDERPTFVLMGLHHAREWPSGENAMEFAYDLVQGHAAGDERIAPLVDAARTVIVPVVNADGFEKSIRDGMIVDLRVINQYDPLGGTLSILATPGNAYKRKNCRVVDGIGGIPQLCDVAPSPGGYGIGVDLNRNYGALHGGPGAAAEPVSPTYHGPHGFSEPETQNIRELVSSRHVTMLISNHTFGNLILRPNGVHPETIGPDGLPIGDAPDEDALRDIGAAFADQNGYDNIHGWELYDTTGTTEDWSYNATGGYGYTFEIGPHEFHPPFPEVVEEYVGAGEYAGKGNREAYLIALEAAIDPATHSIVAGEAIPGATLRLTRTASTPTWEGSFTDTVDTTLVVPADGRFEWRTNPSTRPFAEGKQATALGDEPTSTDTMTGTVPTVGDSVDVAWTAPVSADVVEISLSWALPDDLDLEVYRIDDGAETQVATSGNLSGQAESVTLPDVVEGEQYVLRVINYLAVPGQEFVLDVASFDSTTVATPGLIEAWTLTCEIDGEIIEQLPVIVDRGQRVEVALGACAPATEINGGTPRAKGETD